MTEKNQQLLQELKNGGVKFLPWIGDKYEDGIITMKLEDFAMAMAKERKCWCLAKVFIGEKKMMTTMEMETTAVMHRRLLQI